MANTGNNVQFTRISVTNTGFIPSGILLNGTVSTSGKIVTGINTSFSTQGLTGIADGEYLYSALNNEVRKIVGVHDDNLMYLESPFTVDLLNAPCLIGRPLYESVSIQVVGTGTALIDKMAYDASSIINRNGDRQRKVAPFSYDANGQTIKFDLAI